MDTLPYTEVLDYTDGQRMLGRFLIQSANFNPLDMSAQDITDWYAQLAASLYTDPLDK
jgi:hypothetical protein